MNSPSTADRSMRPTRPTRPMRPMRPTRPTRDLACITGATSGIGSAYAAAYAAAGYDLLLTGRNAAGLSAVAADLGVRYGSVVELFVGDLSDPPTVGRLAARLADLPRITALVHNAGYGHGSDFVDTPPDQVRAMGELHMLCTAELVRTVVPLLTGARPAVVLVASLAAFFPAPGPAMYTATKAFEVALGLALHPALAARGVRLQILCPGFTHTAFHDRLQWSADRRRNRGLVRWMRADTVVAQSLARLARRSPYGYPVFIPGWTNRLLRVLGRLLPYALYCRLVQTTAAL